MNSDIKNFNKEFACDVFNSLCRYEFQFKIKFLPNDTFL